MIQRAYGALIAHLWRSKGRFAPKDGPKGPFLMAQNKPPELSYGALMAQLLAHQPPA
jgi:hypothetical protein